MRIKKGFSLHQLGEECIVIHDGTTHIDFGKLLNLNPTAAYLWRAVEGKSFDVGILAGLLTEAYDVTDEAAHRDAAAFVEQLAKAGVTDEEA